MISAFLRALIRRPALKAGAESPGPPYLTHGQVRGLQASLVGGPKDCQRFGPIQESRAILGVLNPSSDTASKSGGTSAHPQDP